MKIVCALLPYSPSYSSDVRNKVEVYSSNLTSPTGCSEFFEQKAALFDNCKNDWYRGEANVTFEKVTDVVSS